MKIVHAVADENGKAHGGVPGDQTGREIREQAWYSPAGGWKQYIECTDRALAENAADIAKKIAAGNYGYSQDAGTNGRWSGYDAVKKSGVENGCGNFDCSSLVLACYRLAGLPLRERTGSTRNLAKLLTATGRFVLHTDAAHLTHSEHAVTGGIYCTPGRHTVICVGTGATAEGTPRSEESAAEDTADGTGEQKVRLRAKGSVRIREQPETGRTVAILHKGEVIEALGRDTATGWYRTEKGYVTDNGRYIAYV